MNGADTQYSESCEMWLHGKCINLDLRTQPRVYVCSFCANTPNMRGGRMRDTGRGNLMGGVPVASPLASKSFRAFR
ncbi:Protein FAM13A [Fusarium oxysporum f. sp. albedinis]|nr:Protein FAM13A [Fusarium oxysporum f. sp. albedinis]